MDTSADRVLLVAMRNEWTRVASDFINTVFSDVETLFWDKGDPYPHHVLDWSGDWILSFRGDWIVPGELLRRARKGALNFHPSPPRYRGIGSHHYAIHRQDPEFGVTCHHINERIDAGEIIQVNHFTIAPNETASSLAERAGAYCLVQFYDIVTHHVLNGVPLPSSDEQWGETLYTHAGLDRWRASVADSAPSHPSLI